MLILGRRIGETIYIGDDIIVHVCGIHGGQIRLGIEAPKETRIYRKEVYEKINREDEKK